MKLYLLILLSCLSLTLLAQDQAELDSIRKAKRHQKRQDKTHNIIDHSHVMNVKFFGVKKSNLVTHHDGLTNRNYRYRPNENVNIGLGLGYKWLELDVGFNFGFINKDDHIYGTTRQLDIQSNLYLHKFVLDINVQSYEGYYGSNSINYDPTFIPDDPQYPIRPDIKTNNIGFSGLYIFNHDKFSYRAAFNFNERQIRSAGSFLLGYYFELYNMDADSTIVPYQARAEQYDAEADYRNVDYLNMGITLGYGHTFIFFRKYFVSGTIAIGSGPQSQRRDEDTERGLPRVKENGAAAFGVFRGSMGFNSDQYFAGISAVRILTGSGDDDESHLIREVSNFKFFFGVRLLPPKFLK